MKSEQDLYRNYNPLGNKLTYVIGIGIAVGILFLITTSPNSTAGEERKKEYAEGLAKITAILDEAKAGDETHQLNNEVKFVIKDYYIRRQMSDIQVDVLLTKPDDEQVCYSLILYGNELEKLNDDSITLDDCLN